MPPDVILDDVFGLHEGEQHGFEPPSDDAGVADHRDDDAEPGRVGT